MVKVSKRRAAALLIVLAMLVPYLIIDRGNKAEAISAEVTNLFPWEIEGYAGYQAGTGCDLPVKPGTKKLADLIDRFNGYHTKYFATACDGSTTEHHEGRAIDYMVGSDSALGARVLDFLLSSDTRGNAHAIARRFGIMYIIYNNRMYKSWSSPPFSPQTCCWKDGPHTDHLHISLNWPGARGETTGSRIQEMTTIAGRVTVGGKGMDGINVNLCDLGNATTVAGGYFFKTAVRGQMFCVRMPAMPSALAGPITNNNSDVGGNTIKSYEYQIAGAACYHFCPGTPYSWDRNVDSGYDFTYSSFNGFVANGLNGYKMDTFGNVKTWTNPDSPTAAAPTTLTGLAQWRGWNIAKALAMSPTSSHGYQLDGFGGLHPLNGAPNASGSAYWKFDIARDVQMTGIGDAGYVLDGYGALHPFNGAPGVASGPYWSGQDLGKKFALLPNGVGGYELDAWGGIHRIRFNGQIAPPAPAGGPFWIGQDLARDIQVNPNGKNGYVLDAWGGVHGFRLGDGPMPPKLTGPYWKGWDIARELQITDWDSYRGYLMDGYGGTHSVHP